MKMPRLFTAASMGVLIVAASLLSGCGSVQKLSNIEPWVKPYEREHLADPIMKFSRDSLPDKHREHIRDVREGSRGATGVQGGGCGCN
jgi:hypothetical protein